MANSYRYLSIFALLGFATALNHVAPYLIARLEALPASETSIALTLWIASIFLGFGWAANKLTEATVLPNFTLQLVAGVLLHDALAPLADNPRMAVVICTAMAAIILKGGGDEIDRRQFHKLALPTLLLSVVGYLLTFFIMYGMLRLFSLDGPTAALIAAIISSTDPAALIPTLKAVAFKESHKRLSDIAVAESAINDAVGAIMTASVAGMLIAGTAVDTAGSLLQGLLTADNLQHLGQQLLFGCIAGLGGWLCMLAYEHYKAMDHEQNRGETNYDFAIVLLVPLLSFLLAQALHGNGFLAAFIAGLLSNYNHSAGNFHVTLRTMEIKVESIAKPVIFMMVGPFIEIGDLIGTAGIGALIATTFVLVARPLAVMLSLVPTNLSLNERLFLCAIRETGVIPVVLAVITVSQFPQLTMLMPLTAWTVIWTLSVLPALTPWWSRQLKLVTDSK